MSEMSEDGLLTGEDGVRRCWWASSAPELLAYHDAEWGFPVSDDARLFEKLSLEGFQAGLSWLIILRKREAFRAAFEVVEAEGSLAHYIWRFEPPLRSGKLSRSELAQLSVTPESKVLAKDLK